MATASGLISSIQSISTKVLEAIRDTTSTSHQQQDPPSPDTDQNKSVIKGLEKLSQVLARIQAFQQDAEEREMHVRSVQLLAELRGLAYEAEDVLDELHYEVLKSIVESGEATIAAYLRDGVTITEASISDGVAEEEEIISLLDPSNGPDVMVLPIAEMVGVSTTTFAQPVLNDSRIHGFFSFIQSLSTKLLDTIRDTISTSPQQQDASSPVTDQHKSVKEDLEKLSWKLARIQAVQQDAEEREIHDRSVRLWLEELRGVAYQAEDVLDEFYYEVLGSIVESGDAAIEAYHRDGGNGMAEKYPLSVLASCSSYITKISIPNGMAEKIKCITERFEEISNDRHALQLREEDGTRLVIGPQIRSPTSSHVDERAIFGRKEEKEKIISLLNLSTGPDFMVLPIVGMGGLGKTTLAQLVYNDSRICGLFNKRCWVSVSEDFDLVRLTKAIIELMSHNPCQFSELSMLQDVLKENVRGRELFLVLDDVWNEKRKLWDIFRAGFLGAKFVRILTTTRNTSVADIMQTTPHFQLRSLHEETCWLLFKHFVFGTREESENANLHKIGRDIVKKCKGSPLAIKAIGGILRYEMDEEKWKEILESDISDIDEDREIKPVLLLSYNKLPRHLKPCFLYLSMFPKDTPFERDFVVRLWMAQGYINGNTRNLKTLEEIGSEYFDELEGRSLVNCWLYPVYLLHDLIHDLARSISQEAYRPVLENDQQCSGSYKVCHLYLTNQEKLLGSSLDSHNFWSIRTVVNNCPTENFDFAIFSEIGCVRALHLRYSLLRDKLGMLKHLRYLCVKESLMYALPETLCHLYNLQTLDLNCLTLRELPDNIKYLINLRYFHLLSGEIQQLPESIFLLRNLHTLSLRQCPNLKELPRGIEQLNSLNILKLPLSCFKMPARIGKITTLKLLSGDFSVMDHGMIGGLRELKDMNKLSGWLYISGLRNIGNVEYSKNCNLASKPNLHKLVLDFDNYDEMHSGDKHDLLLNVSSSKNAKNGNDQKIENIVLTNLQPHGNLTELAIKNYEGKIIPSWLVYPLLPKLTTLTLNFHSEPNFLPPFGQFPYLKFLEISSNANRDVSSVDTHSLLVEYSSSKNTYSLLVDYISSKQIKKPSYPSLEVLSLRNLLNLVEWQAHDGDFPHLKQLTIENCQKLWKIAIIPQEVRKVTFKYCPKLKHLTCPSVIKKLTIDECGFCEIMFGSISMDISISNCPELKLIKWGDGGLNSIRKVSFQYCPKLEFVTIPVGTLNLEINMCGFREIMFWSVSENLTIFNCVELISVNWSNGGLSSVKNVTFGYCPKLMFQFHVMDVLHSMIQKVDIYKCDRLYSCKRFIYQRDTMITELDLSGNNEICLSENSEIPLLGKPFTLFLTKENFQVEESSTCAPQVGVSCEFIMLNLPYLVILKILRCTKLISVIGLDNLSNLKFLTISYCPELCNWNDKALPLSLESLELYYCEKLSSLPFLSVQNHSSTLKDLAIMNCPRLAVLEGFHGLSKLENVDLLHCRNISISPATESLQFRPHITIGDCPQMRDWCQRNNITYNELIGNPKDDREAELESTEHKSVREILEKLSQECTRIQEFIGNHQDNREAKLKWTGEESIEEILEMMRRRLARTQAILEVKEFIGNLQDDREAELESDEQESGELESDEHESGEHESAEEETDELENDEPESGELESSEHESSEQKSVRESFEKLSREITRIQDVLMWMGNPQDERDTELESIEQKSVREYLEKLSHMLKRIQAILQEKELVGNPQDDRENELESTEDESDELESDEHKSVELESDEEESGKFPKVSSNRREIHDRSFRLWLAKLGGVTYQTEDLLDDLYNKLKSQDDREDEEVSIVPIHREE